MRTFDWKDKYYNCAGTDITAIAKYLSATGTSKSTGSRQNPLPSKYGEYVYAASPSYILGCGIFNLLNTNMPYYASVTGQSYTDTVLKTLQTNLTAGDRIYGLRNLRLDEVLNETYGGKDINIHANNVLFNNVKKPDDAAYGSCNIISSIFKTKFIPVANSNSTRFCTFYNCVDDGSILKAVHPLLSDCEIIVGSAFLSNYTKYAAFDSCRFKIGNEPTATPLSGDTAAQLRQNFVARCTAQGLTVANVTEFEQTLAVGRWVFSNNSITGYYYVKENSEIDLFAKQKSIYLGHTPNSFKSIPIVSDDKTPQSFAPKNPKDGITIATNSITLDSSSSIVESKMGYIDSKIIWLGGKSKLTTLNIVDSLPSEYGLAVNANLSLGSALAPNAPITANVNYLLRSKSNASQSIKYNGIEYSTSLIERKNTFKGVEGITQFELLNGSISDLEVLPVIDPISYRSIQMRIVDALPTTQITTGNLDAGYWYFVEPKNLDDLSGYVTYEGVQRPCFDSFVAGSTLTFAISGNCHLRRCWKQNFDINTEGRDASFWANTKKPYYFNVLPHDLRCLHKNNSPGAVEMEWDEVNKTYKGSGHIDFYNGVNSASGKPLPAFDIVGSFMQIRIPISTLNPM